MDFFITPAWAQTAAASPMGGYSNFIVLGLIFVVFYFLLIRPQTKRAKEHREMVGKLSAGDEIVTTGGILGRISQVQDQFITLEVASGVAITLQRFQVAQLMPKGTYKGA